MATHRVDVTTITKVEPHFNADKLEVAWCFGWPVVVPKGRYVEGDLVVYCPINSILPYDLEAKLFPIDSKIKLNNSRIRAIKIRKQISQGMIIDPSDITDKVGELDLYEGNDVSGLLGITKYEPQEEPSWSAGKPGQKKKVKPDIKAFKKYTDIEHGKYYAHELELGEMVVMTTKLHGTSARFGWFKSEANTFWQKVLNFFGLMPEWTFAWGSRNVQIQSKLIKSHPGCKVDSQGVNFGDVYTKMVHQYDLKNRIPKGMAIYGEIVGDGIQKNYLYGCDKGEHKLYLYDIMKDGTWMNYYPLSDGDDSFLDTVERLGLEAVPVVYHGPYDPQKVQEFIDFNPLSNETNEGLVVRPEKDRVGRMGRVILKWISDNFYLEDNTDFH